MADHELNPSSFAARVAASAGADLHACVSAALATLSGALHGGVTLQVEALLKGMGPPENAVQMVNRHLDCSAGLPGFGHPLSPNGDPRAPTLLRLAREVAPKQMVVRQLSALVDAAALGGAGRPTVDLGLVAPPAALKWPAGGASALFACGRMAGWVGHVIEQRQAGFVLRPRARYRAD